MRTSSLKLAVFQRRPMTVFTVSCPPAEAIARCAQFWRVIGIKSASRPRCASIPRTSAGRAPKSQSCPSRPRPRADTSTAHSWNFARLPRPLLGRPCRLPDVEGRTRTGHHGCTRPSPQSLGYPVGRPPLTPRAHGNAQGREEEPTVASPLGRLPREFPGLVDPGGIPHDSILMPQRISLASRPCRHRPPSRAHTGGTP